MTAKRKKRAPAPAQAAQVDAERQGYRARTCFGRGRTDMPGTHAEAPGSPGRICYCGQVSFNHDTDATPERG